MIYPQLLTFCTQTWYGDATSWAKVSCKKIGLLSSSSGSQWGLVWSDMTVSTISAELLIFLKPNLIGLYIIISWSVLCKNQIVVFEVKITVTVQNCIESLCVLYSLYHWSIGNQSRCAGLLLITTKPRTTKWACADSSTLTYTITRPIRKVGWGVFCHAKGQTSFFFARGLKRKFWVG